MVAGLKPGLTQPGGCNLPETPASLTESALQDAGYLVQRLLIVSYHVCYFSGSSQRLSCCQRQTYVLEGGTRTGNGPATTACHLHGTTDLCGTVSLLFGSRASDYHLPVLAGAAAWFLNAFPTRPFRQPQGDAALFE